MAKGAGGRRARGRVLGRGGGVAIAARLLRFGLGLGFGLGFGLGLGLGLGLEECVAASVALRPGSPAPPGPCWQPSW